jgi:hypothetical protein
MGNAFLQLFMRGGPAALKAVQGFGAKAAPKALKQVADTVTNPQTYRSLAAQAENVLQRGLPSQFAGPNFGNIPARFTGLISDVAGMPAGLQRSAQAGMVNRAIQEAAGAGPQLARSVQQYATGALKAPVIGDAIQSARQVATGLQGALVSPTGFGGPFMRDPALRREFLKQFGGTSEKAARALAGGGGGVNFGQVGSLLQNLSPGGATGLRGSVALPGALGGAAWALSDPTPMIQAGQGLTQMLADRGLVYDPRKDPRVTSIQNRPVVNPGELAPDYSGARDRTFRFAQYQGMGQNPVGGTPPPAPGGYSPPPAPVLTPPQGVSQPGAQAGQQTPIASDVPIGGSFPGGPTYGGTRVSNGAGVPALRQNVQNRALSQEVLNAAQQYPAPTSVPLPSFYEGQQQLGRSMEQTGELQRQLMELGGATGMSPEVLMQWAQQNPGLAYSQLQKLQGRRSVQ